MMQNPFNGIESSLDIWACTLTYPESIQWNWKGVGAVLGPWSLWVLESMNPFNGIESETTGRAGRGEHDWRIHSMELKGWDRLYGRDPLRLELLESIQWNWKCTCRCTACWDRTLLWIHSMELKDIATGMGLTSTTPNPFNGIESSRLCLGVPRQSPV